MKKPTVLATLLAAAASAVVFAPPKGGYQVHWVSSELIDHSRLDPFNSSHPRRMMISRFSPVLSSCCKKTCRVPYMPMTTASLEDEILNAYLKDAGWPKGVIGSLELELCCEKRDLGRENQFPKILFGTGLNTTRLFYSATAQHLSSQGYEIIVMDHPYETDIVQFPDGQIVFGGRVTSDLANLTHGLDVRTQDVSFVMDELKIRKTVYVGQSFGGASAAAAMVREPRIVSGVNLDGALWGPVTNSGVSRPFLTIGAEGHNISFIPSWADFFKAIDENHSGVWSKLLNVNDTVHGSFMDFSLIGDVTGLRRNKELESMFGKASGARVMSILSAYLTDFIEYTLLGKGEGLLKGPNPRFPEVSFLR